DARERDVRRKPMPAMYVAYSNAPTGRGQMTLVVRTTGDPHDTAAAVRRLARVSDPAMPLFDVESAVDRISASTAQDRLIAILSSLFGVLALVIAGIGLYGLMSYTVAWRTSEIGIRMALGAERSHVLWTVLRATLVLVGVGVAIGVLLAVATTRLIENQL